MFDESITSFNIVVYNSTQRIIQNTTESTEQEITIIRHVNVYTDTELIIEKDANLIEYYGGLIAYYPAGNDAGTCTTNIANKSNPNFYSGYTANSKPIISTGSSKFSTSTRSFNFLSKNGQQAGAPFRIDNIVVPNKQGYRSFTIKIDGIQKKRDTSAFNKSYTPNGFIQIYAKGRMIARILFCHISGSQIRVLKTSGSITSNRTTIGGAAKSYWGKVSATLNLDYWHRYEYTIQDDGTQIHRINGQTITQPYIIDCNSKEENEKYIWGNDMTSVFSFVYTMPASDRNAARYTRIRMPITINTCEGPVILNN